jgi:hypothetical protein
VKSSELSFLFCFSSYIKQVRRAGREISDALDEADGWNEKDRNQLKHGPSLTGPKGPISVAFGHSPIEHVAEMAHFERRHTQHLR